MLSDACVLCGHPVFTRFHLCFIPLEKLVLTSQLLAMDASARVAKKDAATCDKRCEWQSSANQENVERILHLRVTPGSMAASGRRVSLVQAGVLCFRRVSRACARCALGGQAWRRLQPGPLTSESKRLSLISAAARCCDMRMSPQPTALSAGAAYPTRCEPRMRSDKGTR